MTELQTAMTMLSAKYPTVILRVNYPIHKGQPNPKHGMFHFACLNVKRHVATRED